MIAPDKRRFPRVLAQQLLDASRELESLGITGDFLSQLVGLARMSGAYFARQGLDAARRTTADGSFLQLPLEVELAKLPHLNNLRVREAIHRQIEAYDAMHAYREPGGEDDYISKKVADTTFRQRQSQNRARRPASPATISCSVYNHEAIAKYLQKRYIALERGEGKVIVSDAAEHFNNVSESSIRRVLRDYGMTKKR